MTQEDRRARKAQRRAQSREAKGEDAKPPRSERARRARDEQKDQMGTASTRDRRVAPEARDLRQAGKSGKAGASLPKLGVRGTLLFLWRQLTSMQTALFLLLLLAIAAVPGSLYPQRNVDASKTEQYISEHGSWAKFLDTLGFFDVFSSVWFSAIYLLLFVSLVGCVIPRLGVHLRQIRSRPPRTPSRLRRFAGFTRVELPGADVEAVTARAAKTLKRSRYRTDVLEEKGGARSVTSERGYLRETGNLLFHVALLGVLVGVAAGGLFQYRGQITVVEGEGFSNSLAEYDSFEQGAWYDSSKLPSFRFTLDDFRAEYDTSSNAHRFGQPKKFEADVTVDDPDKSGEYSKTLRVNQPLHVQGTTMYLLGNGYAPEVTVKDPDGNVVAEGPIITIPSGDTGYTSQLVIKAPDAQPKQMAVVGFFLPTGVIDEKGPHSEFPGLVNPQLALTVYNGDLGLDDGVPKNAYQVDVSSLTPVADSDGNQSLVSLTPGESQTLADGSSISFDGVKRYAAFDIKRDPFQVFTLVMALSAVLGLVLSLFVPRRRVWVRAVPSAHGVVLEVAGLARSDDDRLVEDVRALAERLADSASSAADPSPSDDTSADPPSSDSPRPAPQSPETDSSQSKPSHEGPLQ
ncbi:cytochrome c biogenesis protein ResB [Brachybacterium halotolerans subsp. kimchii]|uniref:cytochrome c biogenesis protein ResB n=1 Tax=Brachybacterium halotolerans TaxID=2795215 RepID=UPI001E3750C2|nr:cytochrome c biogenesis protein ResB [Brachybacterium halotolerans]UEJ82257.1 cytochrome c biogenesis protein ResB [Brachybacterium halotolerans subsp. kimchii]